MKKSEFKLVIKMKSRSGFQNTEYSRNGDNYSVCCRDERNNAGQVKCWRKLILILFGFRFSHIVIRKMYLFVLNIICLISNEKELKCWTWMRLYFNTIYSKPDWLSVTETHKSTALYILSYSTIFYTNTNFHQVSRLFLLYTTAKFAYLIFFPDILWIFETESLNLLGITPSLV